MCLVLTLSLSGRKYRVVVLQETSVGINRTKVSRGCVKKDVVLRP